MVTGVGLGLLPTQLLVLALGHLEGAEIERLADPYVVARMLKPLKVLGEAIGILLVRGGFLHQLGVIVAGPHVELTGGNQHQLHADRVHQQARRVDGWRRHGWLGPHRLGGLGLLGRGLGLCSHRSGFGAGGLRGRLCPARLRRGRLFASNLGPTLAQEENHHHRGDQHDKKSRPNKHVFPRRRLAARRSRRRLLLASELGVVSGLFPGIWWSGHRSPRGVSVFLANQLADTDLYDPK